MNNLAVGVLVAYASVGGEWITEEYGSHTEISYFQPRPLPELIGLVGSEKLWVAPNPLLSLALVPLMMDCVRHHTSEDQERFRLMVMEIFQSLGRSSLQSNVVWLSERLTSQREGVRSGFALSRTRSGFSDHFFPPNVPDSCLRACDEFLADKDQSARTALATSCSVLYYLVYMHPLKDGNGRLSRLAAVTTAGNSGCMWTGVCAALLHKSISIEMLCESLGTTAWPISEFCTGVDELRVEMLTEVNARQLITSLEKLHGLAGNGGQGNEYGAWRSLIVLLCKGRIPVRDFINSKRSSDMENFISGWSKVEEAFERKIHVRGKVIEAQGFCLWLIDVLSGVLLRTRAKVMKSVQLGNGHVKY